MLVDVPEERFVNLFLQQALLLVELRIQQIVELMLTVHSVLPVVLVVLAHVFLIMIVPHLMVMMVTLFLYHAEALVQQLRRICVNQVLKLIRVVVAVGHLLAHVFLLYV